ncbi:MAG: dihydroneopterin aldolase [Bacteroides sp.]|nr:dihydroneopterin aldolase [Bacteroides sp.]MCM1413726.1 dihydroneopterin aldolase [Bacteroides sp.]MCM1471905.1 dihydroneopterin aldolase [Bacteroides sp.]
MMDKVRITINGLHLRGRHGVLDSERMIGNEFVVDMALVCRADEAVSDDRLDGSVNYAEVIEVIKDEMAVPSQLLENVCGRLRDAVIARFPKIESGWVRVAKPAPPIANVQLDSVAVELSW